MRKIEGQKKEDAKEVGPKDGDDSIFASVLSPSFPQVDRDSIVSQPGAEQLNFGGNAKMPHWAQSSVTSDITKS